MKERSFVLRGASAFTMTASWLSVTVCERCDLSSRTPGRLVIAVAEERERSLQAVGLALGLALAICAGYDVMILRSAFSKLNGYFPMFEKTTKCALVNHIIWNGE